MSKKFFVMWVVAAIAAVFVAGCSETEVDPYAQVSLHQATYGPPVISKGDKYKIVNPEIVEAVDHLCLIREGNVVEFIAGRSIADKLEGLDTSNITFHVVKKYTPFVHFKVEQVISGQDTVFMSQAGSILYPRIRPADQFTSKDHSETAIDRFRWNDTQGLRRALDGKYAVTARLAKVEEDGEMVWMLQGERATFRVADPHNGLEIVLRLIQAQGADFDGGITFVEEEDWPVRRNNHISGTVNIDYVKFLDRVFS
jgi:hypothetical protein